MKYLFSIPLLLTLFFSTASNAQCGGSEFCNVNTGLYSNDDAANIAYDNMGSAFHATYIKAPNGTWKVWGENMKSNAAAALSPIIVNTTNYAELTGTIYKIGVAGVNQLIVLTSTGLFAGGHESQAISAVITNSSLFHKITVNGKADGLPPNVTPDNVKMLFVTNGIVMITTCTGEVFVLGAYDFSRGNGFGQGSPLIWSQVMEAPGIPLTNVIVSRGTYYTCFALKADGTIWTWGYVCLLGNGSPATQKYYATQMTLPAGIPGIKMIQATVGSSYYILGTDKKVYSLGDNSHKQLGDRTSSYRTVWVNAKNPDNSIITDAAWISANEHDNLYGSLAVICQGGKLYNCGTNSNSMIGRNGGVVDDFLEIPLGINATDVITQVESGGHSTAVIKLGSTRYGYVGHRIAGSMGDGTSTPSTQATFDFITPPIVAVCGTLCTQPVITTNSPICPGSNAVFTITGTPGDIVSYALNGGSTQTIAISAGGSVAVTVANAVANQSIHLSFVLGGTGACSNFLSLDDAITVSGSITSQFTQVPSICAGDVLNPLPTTSNNGVVGTWTPNSNNTQTTLYTFTPQSGSCASIATMTIIVNPVNTIPTFTQVAPICLGETLSALPTTSINGIEGSWSPAINNQVTTLYTFTPATLGACIPNTTMTIQILPATIPVFNQVAPICEGDTLNPLSTQSINTISGSWAPAITNLVTTTYTFTPVAGSCASTKQMTIVVNPKPTPAFTQVAPICEGSTLSDLPLSSTNGIVGTWSPVMNNMATTTYTFTPATGVCANTAPMTIIVNPKINPLFPSVPTLCYGDTGFNLPAMSTNGITGTWSPAFSNTETSAYTFTPNIGECANTASLQIGVFSDFDFDYRKYCEKGDLMLQISPKFESFDLNTATFNWEQNGITVGNSAIFNVTSYLNATTAVEVLPITFEITVTNANGCDKTKSIPINNVYCDIQKGISPNDDTLNDFFDLRLLDVKHLSIFNRYGVKVYSKSDYYDEWKGQTDSGSILPDGVYFYVIDFTTESSKTGWIYINKEH